MRSAERVVLVDTGTGVLAGWFSQLGAIADLGAELRGAGTPDTFATTGQLSLGS